MYQNGYVHIFNFYTKIIKSGTKVGQKWNKNGKLSHKKYAILVIVINSQVATNFRVCRFLFYIIKFENIVKIH